MSTLRTVDDLRADALFRAGEPTDSTSSFYSKSLEYLNRVQQALLLGGGVSAGRDLATSAGIYAHLVDLPITDWWWARKRGVFNSIAQLSATVSGTLTQGTTQQLTVTAAITQDIKNWYVVVPGRPTVYRVQESATRTAGTEINLDAAYVDDTIAAPTLTLAKMEYDLAGDFIRFASTPYIHSTFGAACDVSGIEQRNQEWPLAIIRQGRPTRAFMVGQRTLALNAYDTRPYRAEYEYIAMPSDLNVGQYPVIPAHHRSVLSAGASMLMLFDKGDGRAANMASEYRELVGRMVQEHRRAIGGGSSTFGQFRFRKSGIPKRPPQNLGELFLV